MRRGRKTGGVTERGEKDDRYEYNGKERAKEEQSRDDYKNITEGWLEKKEEKGQDYRGGRKTGKEPVTD